MVVRYNQELAIIHSMDSIERFVSCPRHEERTPHDVALAARVSLAMRIPLSLLSLLVSVSVAAAPVGYTKVLLPAYSSPVHGVGGTFQGGLTFFSTTPCNVLDRNGVPQDLSKPGAWAFPMLNDAVSSGRFLFVQSDCADLPSLHTALRFVPDDQRAVLPQWNPRNVFSETRLPAIRETHARTGIVTIPGILFDWYVSDSFNGIVKYRHRLTVYSFDAPSRVSVRVQAYTGNFVTLSQSFDLILLKRDGSDATFPYYGDAEIEAYCLPATGKCGDTEGYVEIIPQDYSLRYWAMVTSVDNATGQVVVSVP